MAWLIGIPSTVVVLFISAILNGWVISCLWDWFMTPMGAPHMPVTSALGLAAICQALFYQEPKDASAKYKDCDTVAQFLGVVCIEVFFSRLTILCMGWIVTLFQ